MLLTDDLLVLELEKFPLFLEIGHNLTKALLQELDLRLEHLDLLVLLKLLLRVFFDGLALGRKLSVLLFVVELYLGVLIL